MKVEDKYVAIKVPKDLHTFLKASAKKSGMTLGNYLFDCICNVHGIKYVPAKVEIPAEFGAKEVAKNVPGEIPTEVKEDIEEMETAEEIELEEEIDAEEILQEQENNEVRL